MQLTKQEKKQRRNQYLIGRYFKDLGQYLRYLNPADQLNQIRHYNLIKLAYTVDDLEATSKLRYLEDNPNFTPWQTRKTNQNAKNFAAREMLAKRREAYFGFDSYEIGTDSSKRVLKTVGTIAKLYDPRHLTDRKRDHGRIFCPSMRYRNSPKDLDAVKDIQDILPGANVILI